MQKIRTPKKYIKMVDYTTLNSKGETVIILKAKYSHANFKYDDIKVKTFKEFCQVMKDVKRDDYDKNITYFKDTFNNVSDIRFNNVKIGSKISLSDTDRQGFYKVVSKSKNYVTLDELKD